MKKEKQVKTYQRRTKSGKLVTVKAHSAKYDSAEKAKEAAKKKGSGDELEGKKKLKRPIGSGTLGPELKEESDTSKSGGKAKSTGSRYSPNLGRV